MKIIAYCPLHYGAEYLRDAVAAVYPVVDKVVILYTESPSYGHATDVPCPEPEGLLQQEISPFSRKTEWVKIKAGAEGEHRNKITAMSDGYDIILPIDSDEVWDPASLEGCLKKTEDIPSRRIGLTGFIHFWKSFNYACRDHFTPIRIIKTSGENTESHLDGTIYHFGYAQSEKIMRYKWAIHGHKDELRPGWMEKYLNWEHGQEDVHPTTMGLWNPKPFDKTTLPEFMKTHPNYDKETIV